MKRLWIAFLLLATLGSIYPFSFQFPEMPGLAMRAFLGTCCTMSTRGDILGNIILFVPIGFTGVLAARQENSVYRRFAMVCLTAACVAFLLQLLQFFLPSRDENLQDVLWNVFGTAVGAIAAGAAGSFFPLLDENDAEFALVPVTLIGAWLAYRLIPFVPSLDWQLIKDSVRPLFSASLSVAGVVHDLAAWIVVIFLLGRVRRDVRFDIHAPTLMLGVFCLEILVVYNVLNWSNVLGAVLAIILWWTVFKGFSRQIGAISILLLVALTIDGLSPFVFTLDAEPFNWLPFHGFLGGSMYINARSAVEKVFLYGSLVYLLWQMRLNTWVSVLLASLFVFLVELAQMYFMGHTPEITDPILVILAALALHALNQPVKTPVVAAGAVVELTGAEVDHLSQSPEAPAINFQAEEDVWVRQKTNLRQSQLDFLQTLATEMNISVSRVIRRIVTQFLAELDKDGEAGSDKKAEDTASLRALEGENGEPESAGGESMAAAEKLVKQSVNLRKEQHDFLLRLSREMDCSASRVVRRIVALFIKNLDNSPDNPDTGKEGSG